MHLYVLSFKYVIYYPGLARVTCLIALISNYLKTAFLNILLCVGYSTFVVLLFS